MILQRRVIVRRMAGYLIGLVALMAFDGCILRPIAEKEIIGTYQGSLPDGGVEVLELKSDGVCDQRVTLRDGRKFSASGTWSYDKPKGNVKLRGVYITVNFMGEIDADLGKIKDTLRIEPVKHSLSGKIIIGADEGETYEKK